MTIPRRGFQRRGPRSITDWGLGPAEVGVNISADGKTLWSLGTTPGANLTLLRTRGLCDVTLLTSSGSSGGFRGAHGIYMMTEDAFLVGVTAALDPLSDANSDMWLWHSFFNVRASTASFADGVNAAGAHSSIIIDSKAMRKDFDPERVMVGVTGVVEAAVATCFLVADTRQLFKT